MKKTGPKFMTLARRTCILNATYRWIDKWMDGWIVRRDINISFFFIELLGF
jgi:hypothetical protein